MISRHEFENLETRVSHIETVLNISSHSLEHPQQHIPYTLLVEKEKFANADIENLDTTPFYDYLENDYHIFVRIFVHDKILPTFSRSKMVKGFYEYVFIQNYYSVLIIKHSDLGTVAEHIMPKMNTMKTSNLHQYVDKYKSCGLFFGYSNVNEQLKEGDNLFLQGKGVFFIINDHTNRNVHNYVKNHETDLEIFTEGIGGGEIDVYKSKNLTEKELVVKIYTPQQPTKKSLTPSSPSTVEPKEQNKQPTKEPLTPPSPPAVEPKEQNKQPTKEPLPSTLPLVSEEQTKHLSTSRNVESEEQTKHLSTPPDIFLEEEEKKKLTKKPIPPPPPPPPPSLPSQPTMSEKRPTKKFVDKD